MTVLALKFGVDGGARFAPSGVANEAFTFRPRSPTGVETLSRRNFLLLAH